MVSPTVTIPVNFKSNADSTGHYKKITITITEDNMVELQAKAELITDELHDIDGRGWDWSLPFTTV